MVECRWKPLATLARRLHCSEVAVLLWEKKSLRHVRSGLNRQGESSRKTGRAGIERERTKANGGILNAQNIRQMNKSWITLSKHCKDKSWVLLPAWINNRLHVDNCHARIWAAKPQIYLLCKTLPNKVCKLIQMMNTCSWILSASLGVWP